MPKPHVVTIHPAKQQPLPASRADQIKFYLKVGAVLLATTAMYAVARTTRLLPQWQSSVSGDVAASGMENTQKTNVLIDPSHIKISLVEEKGEVIQETSVNNFGDQVIQSTSENRLTDFQEVELVLAEQNGQKNEKTNQLWKSDSHKRKLLETSNTSVVVANPIPNQIIQIGKPYMYDLNQVFSKNYAVIGAVETGKNSLSSWLTLQYKQVTNYPSPFWYNTRITISENTLFLTGMGDISLGLRILDVSDPADPHFIADYPGFGGGSSGIYISGNTAFVANGGGGLNILNITDIRHPTLLANYPANGHLFYDVAISGNVVFVAAAQGSFALATVEILDISNLRNPRLILSYQIPANQESFYSIVVAGKKAFLTRGQTGLQILDVSNPMSPVFLSTHPTLGQTVFVAVSGNIACVADGSAGLKILDVSNSALPRLLSTYGNTNINMTMGVEISGNLVVVADQYNGIQILDVSDPSIPRMIGVYPAGNFLPLSVTISQNIVFCVGAAYEGTLQIIDIKQASLIGVPLQSSVFVGEQISITVIAQDTTSAWITDFFDLTLNNLPTLVQATLTDQSIFPNRPFVLSLNSEQLFTNPSSSFLRLSIELINGEQLPNFLTLQMKPALLSTYLGGLGIPGSIVISGNTLFMVQSSGPNDFSQNLYILDIHDRTNPILLCNYPLLWSDPYGIKLEIYNNTLFLFSGAVGLLKIFNITNLMYPIPLSIYSPASNTWEGNIIVSDHIVFMASGSAGLQILDVSNLTSPKLVWREPPGNEAFDIALYGNILFKTTQHFANVSVFDVSNTSSPLLLGNYLGEGSLLYTMALSANKIFAISDIGLQIIDVSNSTNPKWLGKYSLPGIYYNLWSVAVSSNLVLLASGYQGLEIIDTNNFTNPKLLGGYSAISGKTSSVTLFETTAFIINDNLGLQILDLRTWELTANPTTADEGNYHLKLTATDIIGSSVSKAFTIRVEGPPRVHNPIPAQYAKVGQSFYLASAGTFTDPNFDPLVFTLAPINSTALPAWLNFDPVTVTFSGIPAISDMGMVAMQLTATDPLGGTASNTFNITITRPPDVANVPQPLTLIQGVRFTYIVPSNTFNSYGVPLSYDLVNGDGSPLPWEFSFTAGNLTLSGTPANAGIINLLLTARDSSNGELSTILSLLIHANLPVLPSQYAKVSQAFNYYAAISDGLNNPRFNPLVFVASRIDQAALPSWLNFNPGTLTFTGTPAGTDIGTLTVRLTARDSLGDLAEQRFNITVVYPPKLVNPLQPVTLIQGVAFRYTVPSNTFNNYGQALSYVFSNGDGSPLSSEFSFIPATATLSGVPQRVGITNLLLTARDTLGDTLSSNLGILVHANLPVLPSQYAKVSQAFSYYAAISDGLNNPRFNPLVFAASRVDQTALPSWLNFNLGALTFTGTPAGVDIGTLAVRLTAQDSLGNLAEQKFNITVIYPPELVNPLQPVTLIQGVAFRYTVPPNTFNSHGQALSYIFSNRDGSPLSFEFSFTPETATLSGVPQSVGITNLLLTARDTLGDTLSSNLGILIHASLPTIPNQYAKVSEPFNYYASLSDGLNNIRFSPLIFSAMRADQTPLPGWLSFNPGTSTFVGTPGQSDLDTLPLRLTATDSLGNKAYTDFNLTVLYVPVVNSPIPQAVNLVTGRNFSFSIPTGTFYSYGQALTYTLKNADGSEFIPPWVQFNPNNGTLFGTPSNIGAVTLLIVAEDAAHNQVSTPLSLIISTNAPPQVMQPISTQTAQVGQLFNFFVPTSTFADPNGDTLTYSASLLGGSAFPGWLSFDSNTGNFKGTPGGTDTDAFSARIYTIVLVASDPEKAKAETLFNLNVGGTSSVASALKIGAPIISVLGALFGLYRNRIHIINRARYPKYQKPNQEIRVGEPFILQLSTPRHLVRSVKAKTVHVLPPKGCGRYTDCQRFFKKPLHYLQLPFDKLPGGESLPRWIEYDEDHNILYSKGPVPDTHYRELNIRVKDKNGVVTEQFNLRIEGATLVTLPEERERKSLSTLPTHARLQQEQNQSAIEMPAL